MALTNMKILAGKVKGKNIYFYPTGRVIAYHKSDGFQYDGYFADENRKNQVLFSFVAKNISDLKNKIKRARSKFPAFYLDSLKIK